jgi:hypothetical protein
MGTEKEPSPRRFFVRVFAEEPDELVKLRDSGLDLFPGVKRPGDAFPRSVDGLLAVEPRAARRAWRPADWNLRRRFGASA